MKSYAACDKHTYYALTYFASGEVVRVDRFPTPRDDMKCVCTEPATFRLIQVKR